MRRLFVGGLSLFVAGVVLLMGCGSGRGKSAKYRIAVIPKGTTHFHWIAVHAGAVHAARERGNAEVLWEGPAKEDERVKQQEIVERYTSEGVHAIVLAPVDRQMLIRPVEGALKKGIPVVIFDSGIQLTETIKGSDKYLGYVATDNRQGGVEGAKRVIELFAGSPKKNRVLMLPYQAGSESTEQREAGFRDTIKTAANIEYIEAKEEAGATVDTAQRVAELILAQYKDLDAIFAPNESSATGILRALRVNKLSGTIKLVGFDNSQILVEALASGELHGTVMQDPFGMGYEATLRAIDFLEGKKPPEPVKYTRLQMVTKENMNEPDVKLLYARDLKAYLGE
jgi:ribose transport system substrate-binding protein